MTIIQKVVKKEKSCANFVKSKFVSKKRKIIIAFKNLKIKSVL